MKRVATTIGRASRISKTTGGMPFALANKKHPGQAGPDRDVRKYMGGLTNDRRGSYWVSQDAFIGRLKFGSTLFVPGLRTRAPLLDINMQYT